MFMSILIFFLRETNPNLKKKKIIIIHRSKILKAFENETHTKRPKIISIKSITRIIELLLIRKSILSRCYRRSVTTDSNESDRKKGIIKSARWLTMYDEVDRKRGPTTMLFTLLSRMSHLATNRHRHAEFYICPWNYLYRGVSRDP